MNSTLQRPAPAVCRVGLLHAALGALSALRQPDTLIYAVGELKALARPKYSQPGHVQKCSLNLLKSRGWPVQEPFISGSATKGWPDGPSELSLNTEKTLARFSAKSLGRRGGGSCGSYRVKDLPGQCSAGPRWAPCVKDLKLPLDKGQAGSTPEPGTWGCGEEALFPSLVRAVCDGQAIKTKPETNHLQSQCKYWKGCGFAVHWKP